MQDKQDDHSDLYEHYRFTADSGQQLLRIDKFLVNRIENASRTKIQAAAAAGNILVNNHPVRSSYKIKPGDVISILLTHPPRDTEILPEDIPLNIVYEDDELIILNKQAGMVVHPAFGNYTGTLVNALMYHLRDLPLFNTGEMRPGLVHRLDKDTSGIMVVAKTELSLNKLARQFYNRTTDRKYNALVWGNMEHDNGTISGHIGRNLKDRQKMAVFPDGEQGKHAVTHYSVIEHFDYTNLIECKLETGRTHQIRVHMEYYKHPIFNDEKYGGNIILKGMNSGKYKQFVQNCFELLNRPALHARSLGFTHPVNQKTMFFDSELPDDMRQVIEKWRKYSENRA